MYGHCKSCATWYALNANGLCAECNANRDPGDIGAAGLAGLALEFWRSSGERTRERLEVLVDLVEGNYTAHAIDKANAKRIAWDAVKSWELFERGNDAKIRS